MGWYNANWASREKITIPKENILGPLTNNEVLITADNLDSRFWNRVKSDGSDIVVTSSDGTTKLKRELAYFNTTDGIVGSVKHGLCCRSCFIYLLQLFIRL